MANALLYGFQTFSEDALNTRAAEVPEAQLAIEMSTGAHVAAINNLAGIFAERTTGYTARFEMNGGGVLEPLDEFGRSSATKSTVYSVAWPLKMGGGATGFTWLVEPRVTVRQLNSKLTTLYLKDWRWIKRQILGAIFDNTAAGVTWTDPEFGALTLRGLANGDAGTLYYKTASDALATDTHYFASASAIADGTNPFTGKRDELLEHPENGGQVVALLATSLVATTKALTEFRPISDPFIRVGSDESVLTSFPTGSIPPDATPLGYLEDSQMFVAEWPSMPADYWIAYPTEGERPLAMREDELEQFRGFFPKDRKDQFPWMGDQWIRRAGFAARNRAGALVMRMGNGTYAIPTGYGLLMAS